MTKPSSNSEDDKIVIYSSGFNKLVKTVNVNDITLDTIVLVIIKSIEITDGYKTLTGSEKKNMVIALVNLLIKRYIPAEEFRDPLIDFMDSFGNTIIDNVVSVSKHKFKINSKKMYERFKLTFFIYRLLKRLICYKTKTKHTKEEQIIMNSVFSSTIPPVVAEGEVDIAAPAPNADDNSATPTPNVESADNKE